MREQIFSPAFGNRPSYLVGREETLSAFERGLDDLPGSKARSVLLLGQRGSGKTVLLWELGDRARAKGFVVASPTVSSEDMLERIVEKIQEDGERVEGKGHAAHITGASVEALGFSVGLEFNEQVQESKSAQFKLTQLARKMTAEGHGILILVDELQANSSEVRRLITVYQELIGEGLNVALVMAGLPGAVSATLNDHVLTFLNRAQKEVLGPLSASSVDAFFQRAFRDLGIGLSDTLRRRAVGAIAGSPYLLQLVGYNIALRLEPGEEATEAVVEAAISASEEDFKNDVCKTTLAALSEGDCAFLAAMADDDGASRMSEIADRLKVSPDYAQKYRRRLIDAGVIEVARRGYVQFAVPYLRDYLRDEDW